MPSSPNSPTSTRPRSWPPHTPGRTDIVLTTTTPAGTAKAVFRADDLAVTYRSSRGPVPALSGFSTTLHEGEFLSVLGPSGCGKSTLLKVASGLLKPSAGVAELGGTRIQGPRKDVGIVFQHATLLPWQTVLENVMLPIRTLGMDRQRGLIHARELLRMMGLEQFENHYPHELSGGMQQRVGIARGLVHDPNLLLMDEPFAALDAMTRESMMVELQRIWMETRKSVLFITHSIPEAVFLSSRIIVLSPRPARIVKEMHVDLPLPRNEQTLGSPRFGELCAELRALFSSIPH
ncbi:ABC transporter [Achromobacter sp. HZ28]|nr:ABC transporter [Achromobacter sp. HZ34]OWT79585.1 ABC transporter [Achromobacter sp. HZ28]